MEALAYYQNEVFDAASLFARTEGFVVAPETAHAVKAAIDFARICKNENKKKVIVFGNSGHGHFDLSAYDAYNNKQMKNYAYPEEEIKNNLKKVPLIKEVT
jgi:tryptophan synthase beta chain